MLAWDTDYIFSALGGTNAAVAAACAEHAPLETPPRPETVAIWRHRRRVSALWLPVLVSAAMKKTGICAVADLFRDVAGPHTNDKDALNPEDCGL